MSVVQDDVAEPFGAASVECLVEVRGACGQDVDALMQVAVAGGLRDPRIPGQAVHAGAVAEPAQHQHGLAEAAQRPGPARGADAAAMGRQQPGQVLHHRARDVERGNMGDQREASGSVDDLVVRTVLSGALRLPAARVKLPVSARNHNLIPLRVDHFAEKT